jgi:hypothetical protein
MSETPRTETAPRSESRRAFLMTAGKVALAAPPVMTMVMAAGSRPAHAYVAYKNNNTVNNNTKKNTIYNLISKLIKR